MSTVLIFACLWVFAATAIAMLPIRYQTLPGAALGVGAFILIGLIWRDHGAFLAGLAVLAFVSMFRSPLGYLLNRLLGRPVSSSSL